MNISKLIRGGHVKRYHTETLIGHQTVSEHSWGVVVIINKLWPDASKELILAAIYHDTAEEELGDIPAPTKRILNSNVGAKKLIENIEKEFHYKTGTNFEANLCTWEKTQLKLADYLELVLFCQHQRKMGNKFLEVCEENGKQYVIDLIKSSDRFQSLSKDKVSWIYNILNKGE